MSGLSGDALVDRAEAIQSKADFASFLQLLLRNYRDHPNEWENNTLERFLEAMGGFVDGLDGYYSNIKMEVDLTKPGWRVFADILLAGRVYD
jgi:hypothetical protein